MGLNTPEEPFMYVPVFESYEAAFTWSGGDADHIFEVWWKVGGEGAEMTQDYAFGETEPIKLYRF